MAIIKNECDVGIKPPNTTNLVPNEETSKLKGRDTNVSTRSPLSTSNPIEDDQAQQSSCDPTITESSKLLNQNQDPIDSKSSNRDNLASKPKRSLSTITSNYLPEEASPLLKQKQVLTKPSSFDGLRPTYRPKPTLLYATTTGEGGRSASIAVSSSRLEPTYPWDYDLDNDEVGDNTSFHSDGFSGMVRGGEDRRHMYSGSNDEYQHPSLETRKLKPTTKFCTDLSFYFILIHHEAKLELFPKQIVP